VFTQRSNQQQSVFQHQLQFGFIYTNFLAKNNIFDGLGVVQQKSSYRKAGLLKTFFLKHNIFGNLPGNRVLSYRLIYKQKDSIQLSVLNFVTIDLSITFPKIGMGELL